MINSGAKWQLGMSTRLCCPKNGQSEDLGKSSRLPGPYRTQFRTSSTAHNQQTSFLRSFALRNLVISRMFAKMFSKMYKVKFRVDQRLLEDFDIFSRLKPFAGLLSPERLNVLQNTVTATLWAWVELHHSKIHFSRQTNQHCCEPQG